MTWEQRIVEAGYRKLAKEFHPDTASTEKERVEREEQMRGLNAAAERMRVGARFDAERRQRPAAAPFPGAVPGSMPFRRGDAAAPDVFDFLQHLGEMLIRDIRTGPHPPRPNPAKPKPKPKGTAFFRRPRGTK